MAIPVEIGAAPLEEAFNDELFRVLQDALDFSVSACQFDIDQEGQLACEQYDKSILYIDEILGKLPSHTPQYSKLMQLRFSYDDRMELLKNLDTTRQESTPLKVKGNDKKRLNPRSFEEDERLLNVSHSVSGNHMYEQQPESPIEIPYWRLRQIQKSITNGSFLSPNVFVPAGVWTQKGVKLCGISIKSSAFQEILVIIKEIDYTTEGHEQNSPTPTKVLQSLLTSLRIAYEEMAAIQNQLSKPFLFIQEIAPDDSTKSSSKGQVALSRFTSIVATFGKSVINFAEVGYQRLGTMATKITEEDFATYTALLSHTCESCQVFERIRIFVDDESDKLTADYGPVEVRDDSALLARAAREFDDVTADPNPDSNSNSAGDAVAVSGGAGDAVVVAGGAGASDSAGSDATACVGHVDPLSPLSDDPITISTDDTLPKDIIPPALDDVMQEDSHHPSDADFESWIILQDLSLVLSNISNFMKDVVCEVLLRDTEVLTLRHILKTRKNFSRMYWDDEQSYKDENQGLTDF